MTISVYLRLEKKTFENEEPSSATFDIVQLNVECAVGLNLYITAHTLPIVCSPLSDQAIGLARSFYPHLNNLPLADYATGSEDIELDILLGLDYYWPVVSGHTVQGENNHGPITLLTRFGYVLNGPIDIPCQLANVNFVVSHVMKVSQASCEADILRGELKKFWDFETLDIKPDEPSVYDKLADKIKQHASRYEVSLPFKEDHEAIPDNFSVSGQRLKSFSKKLRGQPDVLNEYNRLISKQCELGIIERVDLSEQAKVHCLPHRPVASFLKVSIRIDLLIKLEAKSKRNKEVLEEMEKKVK